MRLNMYPYLLLTLVKLSEESDFFPLSEDEEKYNQLKAYLESRNVSWDGLVALLKDMDVLDIFCEEMMAMREIRALK